jgi:hypothetical protein
MNIRDLVIVLYFQSCFQLVGLHLGEEIMFKVAHVFEQNTDWHKKHPQGY